LYHNHAMNLDSLFPHGMIHYAAGGVLIGLGIALLFVSTGLIGGISSFFTATWSFLSNAPFFQQDRFVSSRQWRIVYALGLFAGAAAFALLVAPPAVTHVTWWQLLVGGFIAGFGARLSNGCTSGHGVCGLGSLQLPSLVAVMTFIATGMITAQVVRALGGA